MHGILAYTFLNTYEKNHKFLSSIKTDAHKGKLFPFFCLTVDRSALTALLRFVFDLLYNLFVQLCSSWQEFDWYSASRGPSAEAQLIFNARNRTRRRQTQQWSHSTVNPVHYCRVCMCVCVHVQMGVNGWRVRRNSLTNWRHTYQLDTSPVCTRASAISEWPGDASCQLKSCQLPRNSAETTCTTSPEPSTSCR